MRKGKMILALTFLVVMVALFAAGCGGGKTTVETPKQQIIIRFYSEEAELSSAIGEVGKSVTMPQEPQKTGHVFEGWYLDNNTWQQVFDADYLKNNAKPTSPLKVFAKWVRLRNLELSASVQAGGSVQGETGSHKENEEISVRAVPNEGYTFDGWFNEGAKVSSATEYTFVMPERDYSLQAKFSLEAFQLTIESESESKGTVTGNKGSINFGTFVSVTAEPAAGYSFDGWYEDDTKVGSDVFYTFNMPSRAVTLVAKFKTEKYMLTIENSNPASGAISAGGLKSNGEAVTVTATANTGYSFAGWYEGETLKSSNAQYAFAMPAGNLTLSVRWELITYSMTYESGDGSFADGYNPPESFTVESEDVVLPGSAEISKEGYSFYKWYEDGDPTETAITIIDTASAKNYELIAVWTPNSYLLSVISGNENAGSVSGGGMKVFGSETTVTATPADQSHEFSGWYDGAVLVSTVAEYTFTMPARGLTLTARWDALIYSITYKLGSGLFAAGFTPPMGYSTDDEDITLPQAADMLMEGYTFIKWYREGDLSETELTVIDTASASDYILVAVWAINSYLLGAQNANPSRGNVAGDSGMTVYNSGVMVFAEPFPGYNFEGWYEGDTKVYSGANYGFIMPARAVSLTARFGVNKYNLTANNQNESAGSITSGGLTGYGAEVILTATANTGYFFAGWYEGETLKSTDAEYTFVMPAEDLTIMAKWTLIEYTVAYDTGDGGFATGYSPIVSYTVEDEDIALPTAAVMSREGYSFVKWYEEGDVTKTTIATIDTSSARDYSLVGEWSINSYVLALQLDNALAGTALGGGIKTFGAQVTVSITSNTGYEFSGWYEGETPKSADAEYTFSMPAEDLTLTAKWTLIAYTITYDTGDGGFVAGYTPGVSYTVEDNDIVLPSAAVMSNEGYNFIKWYEAGDAEKTAVTTIDTSTAKNYSLIAEWSLNSYLLTLQLSNPEAGTLYGGGSKAYGSNVTVSVIPNSEFDFEGWYEGETLKSTLLEYTFIMPARALTLIAKFVATCVQLSVSSENTEIGTVSGDSGSVANNSSVTVIAAPEENYTFNGWYSNGKMVSLDAEYTFTITQQISLIAKFARCDIFTFTYDDQGFYYISQLEGYSYGDMIIPATYNGYPVAAIDARAFNDNDTITSVVISEGIQAIGPYAFSYCDNITCLRLPSTFNYIGMAPFEALTKLKFFEVSIDSEDFKEVDGVLFSKDGTLLVSYPAGKKDTDYEMPQGVTYLFYGCFCGNPNIQNIIIGDGVQTILDGAFADCSGLKNVLIPDSVTNIGSYAFYCCTSLTSILIGSGVTSIGDEAFYCCYELVEVYNYSTLTIIKGSSDYGYVGYYALDIYTTAVSSKLSTNAEGYILYTNGTEIILVGYTGSDTALTLPQGITSINQGAFYGCTALTSVKIPASVKSIGDNAFYKCSRLVEVYNFSSLTITKLRSNASDYGYVNFYALDIYTTAVSSKLSTDADGYILYTNGADIVLIGYTGSDTALTLPQGITSINQYAFSRCDTLTSIVIPDGVTSIGDFAFSACSGLTSITIPDSVTSIGGCTFSDCSSLTSVTIPDSVTSIGQNAFDNTAWYINQPDGLVYAGKVVYTYKGTMPSDTFITFLSETKGIADWAFNNCTDLTSIVIGDNVTSIGDHAFYNCTGLTSMVIGTNVTSIGDSAFNSCGSLTSVTIPDSVTSIGWNAFYGCRNVISIVIPDSVTSIGQNAFYNTAWYNNQPDGLVYAGKVAYDYKGTMPLYTYITLLAGTKGIADSAFQNCTNLSSITIPDSVTNIGDKAFAFCSSLGSITVRTGNTVYHSKGNCLIETASRTLIAGCKYSLIPTDGSVTSIGAQAFSNCTGLISITIPDSITSIGDYAFYYCTGLTSIDIPDSVTSIGTHAFYHCTGLISVVIGDSVTSIGDYAFYYCTGFTSVVIGNSVTSLGYQAFYLCRGLTSIIVDTGNMVYHSEGDCLIHTASKVLIAGCINSIIPTNGSVTSIGDYAFYDCLDLISIDIPDSVTSIGDYAFYYCVGLTSIDIPDSVTSIGNYAFYNCTGITSIDIPDSVKIIGDNAFYNCAALTSATIPDSVTNIGSNAFNSCSNLTIYAEAASIPFGWDTEWNSSNRPVVLGFDLTEKTYSFVVNGGTAVADITTVYLAASPYTEKNGWSFAGWYDNAGCTGARVEFPYNSAEDITLYAKWSEIPVEDGESFATAYTAVEDTEYTVAIATGGQEVYFVFYPQETKAYTIESQGNFDAYGCLYDGSYQLLTSDDNSGQDSNFSISNSLTAGQTYYAIIKMYSSGSIGNFLISISEYEPCYYNLKDDDTYELAGYRGNPIAIVIPSVYQGIAVTSIGDQAFKDCSSLSSIVIPDSVISIGNYSFSDCSNLESILLPEGLLTIGNYAFVRCKIDSVTFPNSLTQIGEGAFSDSSSLSNISFGVNSQLAIINSGVFSKCTALISVNIPANVSQIESNPFSLCTSLRAIYVDVANPFYSDADGVLLANGGTELIVYPLGKTATSYSIPAGVKIIKESVFYSNPVLTQILLPSGLERIESYAFRGTKLTSLSIPASVNYIGASILEWCDSIVTLTIPFVGSQIGDTQHAFNYLMGGSSLLYSLREVTILDGSIAANAFDNLGYITKVSIYGSNTIIGCRAFYSCDDLQEVYIYDDVLSIGEEAFLYCYDLLTVVISDSIVSIGARAFYSDSKLVSFSIGENSQLQEIGSEAFRTCIGLTSVFLPSSLQTIGEKAFTSCYNVASYTVDDDNCYFYSLGGVLFESTPNCLRFFPTKSDIYNYTVPDGVTAIDDYVFYNAQIVSISIPASVISIGDYTFSACEELTTCSFAAGSSLVSIGEQAFYSSGLIAIMMPDTVQTIGQSAFHLCKKLQTIHLSAALTEISQYMLLACESLVSVNIPSGITAIGKSAFSGCFNLETTIIIPAGVQNIGTTAFSKCEKVAAILVDEENQYYKDIDGILYDKSGETLIVCPAGYQTAQLTLPYGVVTLTNNAFYNCKALSSLILANSVTSIGSYVFYNCSNLTSVMLGSGLTTIGEFAFRDCTNLSAITIPDQVTTIGNYAFYNCSGLDSVTIGVGVKYIGYRAFYGCVNLESVIFSETEEWYVTSSSSGTSGTNLTVTDPVTNALYLKTTYVDYYWKRSV